MVVPKQPPTQPPTTPPQLVSKRLELWFHEDCLVWTPNLFFIGDHLPNLSEVFSEAANTTCVLCHRPGASLSCFDRACEYKAFHFACARQIGFYFDESRFTVHCEQHYQQLRQKRLGWHEARQEEMPLPQQVLNF